MEPFAYDKRRRPDPRKRVMLLLAAGAFSAWYFNLVPEFVPVSTGSVDETVDGEFTADDFAALLGDSAQPVAETADADSVTTPVDSADPEPIEDSFPEFAGLEEVRNPTMDADQIPTFDSTPSEFSTSNSEAAETGVQPASFEAPDASPQPETPAVLPADVAAVLNEVDQWIANDEILEAHAALSRMYWKKPQLRPHLYERLNTTAAEIYASPSRHFADPYVVQFGETLDQIALQHKVPWEYLARLNRVTPETLKAGQKLKVLTGPFGAVVDLHDKRMTVHAHGWYVRSYQVGIGKDHSTPTGEYTVQERLENPTWHNPDGGVVDADDPQNPLGEYWIGLGNHIGIHGTIDPTSIGASVSRGCIHLGDQDIAEVFHLLGRGSQVVIRP